VLLDGLIESLMKSLFGLLAVIAVIDHHTFALAVVVVSSAIAYLGYRLYAEGRTGRALADPN
jgi:hypothetical protein